MSGSVVLLPGFGGAPSQPILVKLAKRLAARGFACHRLAPPRGRVTPGLEAEVAWLEQRLAKLEGPVVLIGRSFGGRVCVRVAARRDGIAAVVLLGFPIRPPSKRRPLDEAALREVKAPTLVVQGSDDELGPLRVVRAAAKTNPRVALHVLDGAGHSFGRQEAGALDFVAEWVCTTAVSGR